MMHFGEFLVMRFAAHIGWVDRRRIVSVLTRRATLTDAVETARDYRQRVSGACVWIARVGQRAHANPSRRRCGR